MAAVFALRLSLPVLLLASWVKADSWYRRHFPRLDVTPPPDANHNNHSIPPTLRCDNNSFPVAAMYLSPAALFAFNDRYLQATLATPSASGLPTTL